MTQKIPLQELKPDDRHVGKIRSHSAMGPDKIYPKTVKGIFETLRKSAAYIFLAGYFLVPWLQWDGRQAVLFDLPGRKFYFFSYTFWPQDFFLLSLVAIIAAFGLFLITTYAGRVWCGYSCPQTVWTKIFIEIETFAEGNRNQRIKLASSPWSAEKLRKVSLKHSLWFVVSLLTAIGFLAYFTPIPVFADQLLQANLDPWQWFWLIFFTAATYINAGWMREQVCLHGCPYARFQSIMFDADTLIVSYDAMRGENRGPRKRGSDPKQQGLGDCVDCMQCVHVCPTGIDIRNGLQYECISCAACIDACDDVMGKMGYEKGLVRYTTQNALDKKPGKGLFRPRILTVGVLLAVMGITLLVLLFTRMPAELNVIKDRSALYRESAAGWIENNYILKLLNKTQNAEVFSIKVNAIDALRYRGPHEVRVEAGEVREVPVSLEIRPDLMTHANQLISFKITAKQHPDLQVESQSRFIGPLWVEQK